MSGLRGMGRHWKGGQCCRICLGLDVGLTDRIRRASRRARKLWIVNEASLRFTHCNNASMALRCGLPGTKRCARVVLLRTGAPGLFLPARRLRRKDLFKSVTWRSVGADWDGADAKTVGGGSEDGDVWIGRMSGMSLKMSRRKSNWLSAWTRVSRPHTATAQSLTTVP